MIVPGYEIAWAAGQYRDAVAVLNGARRFTFREVNERANRLADGLRAAGHTPGERIGVLLHNGIESIDATFGLLKGGFCMVPLNTRHAAPEQIEIALDAGLTGLIAGPEFADTVRELTAAVPAIRTVVGAGQQDHEGFLAASDPSEPDLELPETALMRLTYTSGTTGKPKGVVGTHKRHLARLANFFASCEYALGLGHSMGQVGPLSHVAGNYLQPCFIRGARTVVFRSFDPVALQEAIERERLNSLLLVPTMIVRFVEALRPDEYDLSSLQRINYGTAPIPVPVLRRGIELLGPVFRQHYGMSEALSPLTLLYPHEHILDGSEVEVARLASCGRPIVGHRIVVLGDDGSELPPGEIGEIAIRARDAAEVEYWQRPDLTAEAVRDGWFHTGDLGRKDADGYLFIVGRKKDMIISGGFNVYAREVEDTLFKHPDVLEAAVVGLPDREWGEIVAAAIVRKPGSRLDVEAVVAHCSTLIAGYKRPRLVTFVEQMPKTGSGKIAKAEIRNDLLSQRDAALTAAGPAVQAQY